MYPTGKDYRSQKEKENLKEMNSSSGESKQTLVRRLLANQDENLKKFYGPDTTTQQLFDTPTGGNTPQDINNNSIQTIIGKQNDALFEKLNQTMLERFTIMSQKYDDLYTNVKRTFEAYSKELEEQKTFISDEFKALSTQITQNLDFKNDKTMFDPKFYEEVDSVVANKLGQVPTDPAAKVTTTPKEVPQPTPAIKSSAPKQELTKAPAIVQKPTPVETKPSVEPAPAIIQKPTPVETAPAIVQKPTPVETKPSVEPIVSNTPTRLQDVVAQTPAPISKPKPKPMVTKEVVILSDEEGDKKQVKTLGLKKRSENVGLPLLPPPPPRVEENMLEDILKSDSSDMEYQSNEEVSTEKKALVNSFSVKKELAKYECEIKPYGNYKRLKIGDIKIGCRRNYYCNPTTEELCVCSTCKDFILSVLANPEASKKISSKAKECLCTPSSEVGKKKRKRPNDAESKGAKKQKTDEPSEPMETEEVASVQMEEEEEETIDDLISDLQDYSFQVKRKEEFNPPVCKDVRPFVAIYTDQVSGESFLSLSHLFFDTSGVKKGEAAREIFLSVAGELCKKVYIGLSHNAKNPSTPYQYTLLPIALLNKEAVKSKLIIYIGHNLSKLKKLQSPGSVLNDIQKMTPDSIWKVIETCVKLFDL